MVGIGAGRHRRRFRSDGITLAAGALASLQGGILGVRIHEAHNLLLDQIDALLVDGFGMRGGGTFLQVIGGDSLSLVEEFLAHEIVEASEFVVAVGLDTLADHVHGYIQFPQFLEDPVLFGW